MKTIYSPLSLLFMLLILPTSVYSQDIQTEIIQEEQRKAELLRKIEAFDKCFQDYTDQHTRTENFILSTGKTVSSIVRCDFKRKAFISADETLKDVRLWYNSPYLWYLKHNTGNKALFDDRKLKQWIYDGLENVSQKYFEEGENVFHILAHGLVVAGGKASANTISIGGQALNAKEVAELIKLSWKGPYNKSIYHNVINAKQKPFTIVVHSCLSANGDNNFAKQLSEELSGFLNNASVVGSPDVVWARMYRDGTYTEEISSKNAKGEPVGPPQRWRVYHNGKETNQGEYDYRSTVRRIQDEASRQ